MSDQSQGPGWWQASDGKWYPPEQAPGQQPAASAPQSSTIDIGGALGYGWRGFVANLGTILLLWLIVIGVYLGFVIVGQILGSDSGFFISFLFTAAGYLIALLLTVGFIRASLDIVEGRKPQASELFRGENVGAYFIAAIIVGLCTWIGLILCIIPGLLVIFFTFFYGYYIVDKDMSATDGIRASINAVRGNMGNLLGFLLVAVILMVFTCGLAWPIVWIAGAHVYKTINGEQPAPIG